jgi:dTDP-4-amino-4,6-dideoxygalactose transaminase
MISVNTVSVTSLIEDIKSELKDQTGSWRKVSELLNQAHVEFGFGTDQMKQIECRPLICGSIGRHPLWTRVNGTCDLYNAVKVHDYGIYLLNHSNLSPTDVKRVSKEFKSVAIAYRVT